MAGSPNAIQLSSISQINQQEFLLLCFCARPRRRSQEDLLWREPGKACKARRDFVHSGKYRISHLFPHKYERVSFLPLNCFIRWPTSVKAKLFSSRQNFLSQGKTLFPKAKLSFLRQNFLSQGKTFCLKTKLFSQGKTFSLKAKLLCQGKTFFPKAKLSFSRQNFLSQDKTFFLKAKLSFPRQNFFVKAKLSFSKQNFHSQDKAFFLKTKLSFFLTTKLCWEGTKRNQFNVKRAQDTQSYHYSICHTLRMDGMSTTKETSSGVRVIF